MKQFAIFLLTFTFSLSLAHAERGFYKIGEFPEGTPEPVVAASKSVFRVWVLGGRVKYKFHNWTNEFLKSRMEEARAKKDWLTDTQLTFCIRTKVRPCMVFEGITKGTGFLMGRGNLIWTNRHVVLDMLDPWVKAWKETHPNATDAEVNEWVANFSVPFIVRDQHDKRLTINLGKNKYFRYLKYGPNANIVTDPKFMETFTTDLAVVELPETIGEPLPLSPASAALGEKLYILGFPTATFDRKETFNLPDSNGRDLHLSMGERISLDEALARLSKLNSVVGNLGKNIANDPTLRAEWEKTTQFVLADGENGNSGGPILNAKGEVTGIYSARMLEYRGTELSLTVGFTIDLHNISYPTF